MKQLLTEKTQFLSMEIGGTKLQMALGRGTGTLDHLWRGHIEPTAGAVGILQQIRDALPGLCKQAGLEPQDLAGVGIGFGGPVDVARGKVITSHQVPGWTDYPLVADLEYRLGVPVTLGNDADVAGLGEAHWGAGRGIDSLFYITVGSGIGGGFIQNGRIYRGVGIGAAEIGHLRPARPVPNNLHRTVEDWASGWGIQKRYQEKTGLALTVPEIARRANGADPLARETLSEAIDALAEGICSVIALLCPRRIVIGGGVSLLGDELFFAPLRAAVRARVFAPFADTLDLVPAALGEEVVLHGALTLAHQSAGSI